MCSTCAKNKTRLGFAESNRARLGRVLSKVGGEIGAIESSASERLIQIDEMRNRKRKMHENYLQFERSKVIFPHVVKDLFENSISTTRVGYINIFNGLKVKIIET